MFKGIIELFKNPETTLIEKSEEEELKMGIIKLIAISGILSLINIISTIISIFSKYSSKIFWYSSYSSSELWDMKIEALKNAKLFGIFFKQWLIFAVVIAVLALILFFIAKIIKSSKTYNATLSMVNNTAIIYTIGIILQTILSMIYAPIGLLILFATITFSSLNLIIAYRDSLEIENANMLIIVTTGILVATILIAMIVLSSISGVSLKEVTSITSLIGNLL